MSERIATLVQRARGEALPPIEELLLLLLREIGQVRDARLAAELKVRAALLYWDGRGQAEAALSLLVGVDHPVAAALRLQGALETPEAFALVALADEVQRRGDSEEMAEVGELLLWRGEPARAAVLLERAGEGGRSLRALALGLSGRFGEAVEVLSASADPQGLLLGAHLAEDRLGDGERARTLLRRLLERPAVTAEGQLRAVERLLDLEARRGGEAGRIELLRRRLELLGGSERIDAALLSPGPEHGELFLTALSLGQALERSGAAAVLQEAVALFGQVHRFCAASAEGAAQIGVLSALRGRARAEAACGKACEAAALFGELSERLLSLPGSDAGVKALGAAYGRRAAELFDARGGSEGNEQAQGLYERLFAAAPSDEGLVLGLCRLLLEKGEGGAVAAALRTHAEAAGTKEAWLRAARAKEGGAREGLARGGDERGPESGADRPTLELLLRLHRGNADRPRLCAAYRRLGALAADPGSAAAKKGAAYLSAAAALSLEALPVREAAALLESDEVRIGATQPGGVLLHLVHLSLLEKLGRKDDRLPALLSLLPHVNDPQTQADLHVQVAREELSRKGDREAAQRSLAAALAARPEDVVALSALAALRKDSHPAEAQGLLRQAIDAALRLPAPEGEKAEPDGVRPGAQAAALLCCELGALCEGAQTDEAAAQAAACYEEALRADAGCRGAAEALGRLYRKAHKPGELLAALERLLPLAEERAARRALLLEIGRAAEEQEGQGARALSAYAEALAQEVATNRGEQTGAAEESADLIDRIVRLGLALGRHDLLLTTLDKAPRSVGTLRVLRESAERLGRLPDLCRYREEEYSLLSDPQEVLAAAVALAALYEAHPELGRGKEGTTRVYARAYHVAPAATLAIPGVAERLAVLFQVEDRFGDLTSLLGHQLEALNEEIGAAGETEPTAALRARRRTLLLSLGALRRDHLHAPAEAAAAFEQVLREHPEDGEALAALSTVYTALPDKERSGELLRVLDLRAKMTSDPAERIAVLLQAGELSEKAGDLKAAEESFGEAFYLDPSARGAFTALERILYRAERWTEVLRMYDAAVALVVEQKSRAYRLGDLYARRGQVLLQSLQQADEATVAYLKALEVDPDNDAIQTALERIYVADGSWPALIACYEKRAALLREDGKRVEVLRRAARVAAAKQRDVAEAIRLYQKLHVVDPTDSEALDALERHFERSRDFEKLLSILSTRLALSTGDVEAAALGMRIGQIQEEGVRDHEKAMEAYRQVLEHQPSHREALDGLARLFEGNERWAEFIEVSRRQIRLTTDRTQKALLFFKCGSVMEAKFDKEDDAVRYYDAAVKTSPSCLPAVHGLRDIHLRRKDWPRVTQTLELEAKLWTEDKERAGIYAHIGQIYREKLHDLERAIQYYESALAVDKDCLPANRALFDVYFERGDFVRAAPMGQVLSAKVNREGDPAERSEFYRKRAVVAEHSGDERAAAESLVVALEIQPENLSALEPLVALCRRDPTLYDFGTTFRELDKLYRRRGHDRGLGLALVARAVLCEKSYDVDGAEALLLEAQHLSPGDYAVTEALCLLYERLRRFSAAEQALRIFIDGCAATLVSAFGEGEAGAPRAAEGVLSWARARLRLAEMYSDAAMEPEQAAQALRDLLAGAGLPKTAPAPPPDCLRVARFRLVQELYLLGHYSEARTEMDGLIEQAAAPPSGAGAGSEAPPEELARYYDYLGRVLEATGDGAGAHRNYRRAVDLDPGYAQPVLSLARRAAQAGDRSQAELFLREALLQAQRRGDPHEELRLRRGVARLLSTFDVPQAIEAYRHGIQLGTSLLPKEALKAAVPPELAAMPEGAQVIARETLDDRLAIADLQLQLGELGAAQAEIQPVLLRDLRHAPAYRLLSQVYEQLGEPDRAHRVQAVLALLGYADPAMAAGRTAFRPNIRRGTLPDEARASHLLLPAAKGPYLELLAALSERLVQELPPPWAGGESVLATKVADAGFKVCMTDVSRLFDLEVEVLVARGVPGGVLALGPEAQGGIAKVLWDAALLERPDGERRFLMARALEPLRGGYGLAQRLRPAEKDEVARLLGTLLLPEGEWDLVAKELFKSLPRRAQRVVERLQGTEPPGPAPAFLQALELSADRAGLLACDDLSAAIRVLGRLQGEDLAVVDGTAGGVLVGQVAGGAELIRFFVSDGYQELRAAVGEATRL